MKKDPRVYPEPIERGSEDYKIISHNIKKILQKFGCGKSYIVGTDEDIQTYVFIASIGIEFFLFAQFSTNGDKISTEFSKMMDLQWLTNLKNDIIM